MLVQRCLLNKYRNFWICRLQRNPVEDTKFKHMPTLLDLSKISLPIVLIPLPSVFRSLPDSVPHSITAPISYDYAGYWRLKGPLQQWQSSPSYRVMSAAGLSLPPGGNASATLVHDLLYLDTTRAISQGEIISAERTLFDYMNVEGAPAKLDSFVQ